LLIETLHPQGARSAVRFVPLLCGSAFKNKGSSRCSSGSGYFREPDRSGRDSTDQVGSGEPGVVRRFLDGRRPFSGRFDFKIMSETLVRIA